MRVLIVGASSVGAPYRASERIRCDWIAPHIPADKYVPGQPVFGYDVAIWVKVAPTGKLAPIQILDVCDPAWKVCPEDFRQTTNFIDAVTMPTQAAKDECAAFMGDFLPTFIVRDGHDFDWYPRPEKTGRKYVWFGYSHNFQFASTMVKTRNPDDVSVVTNTDVGFGHWTPHVNDYLAYQKIGESRVALLPTDESRLKSNNRDITAWALGLAVAKDMEDLERFEEPGEIEKDVAAHQELLQEHSAQKAAEEMRKVIGALHDPVIQSPYATAFGVGGRNTALRPDRPGSTG